MWFLKTILGSTVAFLSFFLIVSIAVAPYGIREGVRKLDISNDLQEDSGSG